MLPIAVHTTGTLTFHVVVVLLDILKKAMVHSNNEHDTVPVYYSTTNTAEKFQLPVSPSCLNPRTKAA